MSIPQSTGHIEAQINSDQWDSEIGATTSIWHLSLGEIWRYKDLLLLLVRRDFISVYKQTVLGPVWFFVQPIISTLVFTVIFGNIAGIPTDGVPPFLFYLAGITPWYYFADCLTKTSSTFLTNAGVFGKVYFPRLVVPLSVVISNLFKFGIQFVLLLGFVIFYMFQSDGIQMNGLVFLTPVLIAIMAINGLGFGLVVSAMTTKYRDLQFVIGFGVQLMMYLSPVIIPLSEVKGSAYEWPVLANPMTYVISTFRYAFLGSGEMNWWGLGYSALVGTVVFSIGMLFFNKIEKNFMDTV